MDVHNHSDSWLLSNPNFLSKTAQGFTTEVIMADGISYAPVDRHTVHAWIHYLRSLNGLRLEEYQGWESLADYMALLDGRTVQNSIPHIPYANVRALACGFGRQAPDDVQTALILREIEKGMEAGAVGISTGLDYIAQCHASTDELVRACRVMAPHGLYATPHALQDGNPGGPGGGRGDRQKSGSSGPHLPSQGRRRTHGRRGPGLRRSRGHPGGGLLI